VKTYYYLDRDDILTVAADAFGAIPAVRDYGLLDAAIARPKSSVFGVDAYPELFGKAAALLHSLARNHALVDGNKRTAWAAAWVFLAVNGCPLKEEIDVDRAEKFMNDVAEGALDLDEIGRELNYFCETSGGFES
jgi:death-on-curing protein